MKYMINRAFGLRGVLTFLALMLAFAASAQNKITGKVVDENDQPAIGANVVVKGTTQGVSTDLKGMFAIPVKTGDVLVFSYLGYKSQEVKIAAQTRLDIKLVPEANIMDEVVVVGYGAVRRGDLTGSVASVSSKDVEGFKTGSVMEALGGQIAGVQITATDGTPGAGFDIKVRGVGSVNGDTSPLYIVDGFQVDNIDYLSNSDIESIEVLKDASSSAIYGSRAANGVVMVTTKSGKVGRPVVTYNGSASYRQISGTLDLLSPYEFVKLQTEAWPDKFGSTYYKAGNDDNGIPYRYQSIEDYRNVKGVDWQNETFRPTWSQDHNVSVSGGNDKTKYAFSFADFLENGIFKNSAFNKITAKVRVSHKISKAVTIETTVNYANTDKRGVGTSGDNGRFNMLAQILRARPTAGLKMTDEELLASSIDPLELESSESLSQVNPIKQAESVINTTKTEMWSGNLALNINFGKGWTFRTAGTYNTSNARNYVFYQDGSKEAYRNGQTPYGSTRMTRNVRWTNFNYLTYKYKRKRGHAFDVMLGQETAFQGSEYLLAGATDFPFDNIANDNLGLGATPTTANSNRSDKLLVSFFARANYNFRDRYLFTATIRADGSTVFSKNNKWGYFPSFSAAWRISEEKFWEPMRNWWDNAKVRFSYGSLGNQQVSNYYYIETISTGQLGYTFNGTEKANYASASNPISDGLTWETVVTYNLGFDLGFLKNRLNVTADLYIRDTKDMLTTSLTLPDVFGAPSPKENCADLRTKGYEITVSWRDRHMVAGKPFSYGISASLGDYKSKITKYKNDDMLLTDHYVGETLGELWGYRTDGLFKTDEEAARYQAQINDKAVNNRVYTSSDASAAHLMAGDVRFRDLDGNNIINNGDGTVKNPGDMRVIGNSLPRYTYSIRGDLNWNGFDFAVFFQGVGKIDWMPSANCYYFWGPYSFPTTTFIAKDFERGQPQHLLPPPAQLPDFERRFDERQNRPLPAGRLVHPPEEHHAGLHHPDQQAHPRKGPRIRIGREPRLLVAPEALQQDGRSRSSHDQRHQRLSVSLFADLLRRRGHHLLN